MRPKLFSPATLKAHGTSLISRVPNSQENDSAFRITEMFTGKMLIGGRLQAMHGSSGNV